MISDRDVDGALIAVVGLLSELQRDGELGLSGKNRKAFTFHIIESKLAIVKAAYLIDNNNLNLRRLIKEYTRYLGALVRGEGDDAS